MPKKPAQEYGNQSISSLKGADRVRKRPAVIFGSDGLEGAQHSFFEILSNSIDEAREGYGSVINITVHSDHTLEVEDFGRGVPLGWNENEKRFNWELVYCELYAGGKYNNDDGEAYEYSLGLNGLGACATQYSSKSMHVTSFTRDGKYSIQFEKGEPVGELLSEEPVKKRTGTHIVWTPDLDVFTDINIPYDYFTEILKKQAVVNAGLKLCLAFQQEDGKFTKDEFYYKNGIVDYMNELISGGEVALDALEVPEGEAEADIEEDVSRTYAITHPIYNQTERQGRDRPDKPEYKVKIEAAFCFSNHVNAIEYYHNSSFLEHGGSPDKAARSSFVKAFDNYLKATNKYNKTKAKLPLAILRIRLC